MSERRFIIVSGLSGAGKTIALRALEDAGYYCVDNLPASFLGRFASFVEQGDLPLYRKVAVGVDARNPQADLLQFPSLLDALEDGELNVELVFVEATDETLINRFSETRRKHPLSSSDQSLREAITIERRLLETIAARADLRIDTSHTNIHEFRAIVSERVAQRKSGELSLQIRSFGYKHGVPTDADFVFDARCLPNPYWEPSLRELTGRDAPIIQFLDADPTVAEMVGDIAAYLSKWIPRFERDHRSYLTVAIGCTGGRHRSVYVAEQLAARFAAMPQVLVKHRDC